MLPRQVLDPFPEPGNRPTWSYLHTGTLPRLISFICHSCENCRGVGVFFPFWLALSRCERFMPSRVEGLVSGSDGRAVERGSLLFTSPRAPFRRFPFQLSIDRRFRLGRKDPDPVGTLNFQLLPSLSPLSATLTRMSISVDSKGLTGKLTPLNATLTKNTGVGSTSERGVGWYVVDALSSLPPVTNHQSLAAQSSSSILLELLSASSGLAIPRRIAWYAGNWAAAGIDEPLPLHANQITAFNTLGSAMSA
jgi:hypothetical protein